MNNVINNSELPNTNIAWQVQPDPAECGHEFEVIAIIAEGGVVSRCVKCGSLEGV
jgi:hypothetical protein